MVVVKLPKEMAEAEAIFKMNLLVFYLTMLFAIYPIYTTGSSCIKSEDIMFDKHTDTVYANPFKTSDTEVLNSKKNDLNYYWVKSNTDPKDLNIDREIVITNKNVNLCSYKTRNDEMNKKSLSEVAVFPNQTVKVPGFILRKGDRFSFKLRDQVQYNIDSEICKNKNPDIHIRDRKQCEDNFIGSNVVLNKTNDANILKAPSWINGKLYSDVLDKDQTGGYTQLEKMLDNINLKCRIVEQPEIVENAQKINELIASLSQDEINWLASMNNDPELIYAESEKIKLIETDTLNKYCDNLCSVKYTWPDTQELDFTSGNLSEMVVDYIINQDCSLTTSTADGTTIMEDGQEIKIQYAQGLSAYIKDTSSGAIEYLPEIGEELLGGYKGISIDYSYECEFEEAEVYVYIGSQYKSLQGHYSLLVERQCQKAVNNSLYYYVGKESPNFKPGDPGSTKVKFDLGNDVSSLTMEAQEGNLYFGVADNGDGYENNEGYFEVKTTTPKEIKALLSKAVAYLIGKIKSMLYVEDGSPESGQAVVKIYQALIFNSAFINAIKAVLVLFIALYSLFYMVGMIKTPHVEALVMIIKISLIVALLREDSWNFFYTHLFNLFINGGMEILKLISVSEVGQELSDEQAFFFLDVITHRMLRYETWLQLLALMISGLMGFIMSIAILWGMFCILSALLTAIITYAMSTMMIAILIAIAPIFISLILFKKTKAIFDSWIKTLAHFALQPVAVFCLVTILSSIISGFIHNAFNFDICPGCVFNMDKEVSGVGEQLKFCIINWFVPHGLPQVQAIHEQIKNATGIAEGTFVGLPIKISALICFIIIANSFDKLLSQAGVIITSIFGSMGSELLGDGQSPVSSAKEKLLTVIGQDATTTSMRQQTLSNKQLNKKEREAGKKDVKSKDHMKMEDRK